MINVCVFCVCVCGVVNTCVFQGERKTGRLREGKREKNRVRGEERKKEQNVFCLN